MANAWLEATQTSSQEDQVCVTLQSLPCQFCWANLGLSLCMLSMQNTDGLFGQCPNITRLIVIVCPACTVVFGG